MRILIAEDEKDLNTLIKKRLEEHCYSVDVCLNGEEALEYLRMAEYDGVILDIMMPKLDGLTVLRTFRKEGGDSPVLLLTAKDTVEDCVTGLDAGADDYLVKPFSFDELLARVRVMARKHTSLKQNTYTIANLTVCMDSHKVHRGDKQIELSNKEFSILRFLILNQGIVLSRDKIEQHIWNYDYYGGSNVVDVYIRYLRKKIDEGFDPKVIHTVRGAGYVLKVIE